MLISIIGTIAFAIIALKRNETINAVWILTAAICTYTVAYRYYSKFIADKVFNLSEKNPTPATTNNDGIDYVPTSKWVLYGHHFAAIAGAGPLVGPVLAAQMGYLPGALWIIVGAVIGGAVQDFVILVASMRRNGKSLGEIAREEIGPIGGLAAMFAVLSIMIILLAVLSLVVVKALTNSPWGTFTIAMTIPIALFMGVYMRYIRPGRVLEASFIGFALLLLSILSGQYISSIPYLANIFTLTGTTLTWLLIIYGFIASVIPVWLLLTPRDYLSTFLKIGTIFALAIGILTTLPNLKMPAITQFIDGTGPVFAGSLFPFLFITIACGAISGFHALVSSGTTPKMIACETHARMISYGGMLTESFVAIIALISASILTPGIYFAMNSPASLIGTDVVSVATKISELGFTITPEQLTTLASDIGEKSVISRTGGAPTLAVGMATIFSDIIGGETFMAFWYHFAILFEAVFILTTIDAGTRVGRFILQDMLGHIVPKLGRTDYYPANIFASAIVVAGWGYFLYQGVVDPMGGINTLWPLFGIANQMLAVVALIVGTTIMFKTGKKAYCWVTLIPLAGLIIITMNAGWQKIFHEKATIGFLAAAAKYKDSLVTGILTPPAASISEVERIITNNQIDAAVTGVFMLCIIVLLLDAFRGWYKGASR